MIAGMKSGSIPFVYGGGSGIVGANRRSDSSPRERPFVSDLDGPLLET